MVTWILQTDIFEENLTKLKDEIVKQGHYYSFAKYIPFSEKQDFPDVKPAGPVIFYGSLNMAAKIRKATNWIPGVWCNLEKMKCTSYYPYYGKYLINNDYTIIPFGELERLKPRLFERFGLNGDIFIRPDSPSKIFSGGLLGKSESLGHFLANSVVFPEELCIISSPKQIFAEWRLVVCNGEIITGSQYHKNGLLETNKEFSTEVTRFGYEVIKEWQPESCFVLDLGETQNGYGLVEINSFSCSGYYDCELSEIVKHASTQAEIEFNDIFNA